MRESTDMAVQEGCASGHTRHTTGKMKSSRLNLPLKASAYKAGDPSSTPGSGRSPGEGNGTLQYCCLENPMDEEAW